MDNIAEVCVLISKACNVEQKIYKELAGLMGGPYGARLMERTKLDPKKFADI